MDDDDTVAAAAAGDRRACELIARRYLPLARRLAARRGIEEDYVSGAILTLLEILPRYTPWRDRPFSAYARAVLDRALRWDSQRTPRTVEFVEGHTPVAASNPEAEAAMREALGRLDAEELEVVRRTAVGETMREIGQAQGYTFQRAHQILTRARESLR